MIVIQVESLENFVINKKVEGQEITPVLNKLLSNGIYFSNFHEQVNQGNSSDADLLMNTSMYPLRNGVTFCSYTNTKYKSLPKVLKNYGYFSSAFHPDIAYFWNWFPALKSMEFDECYDTKYYKNTESTPGMGISDGCYLRQVEEIIKKQKGPFYSFVVTHTSHSPFLLQDNLKGLNFEKSLDDSPVGKYMQAIHYTDEQIGNFLDLLEKDGILQNSVVAIYGDHEGLHKYFPESISSVEASEKSSFTNEKRIPLIIYNKEIKGKELKTFGGQIDTYPTLAYLLGIDEKFYEDGVMGRNLLNTKKDFAILKNGKVVGNASEADKKHAVDGLNISDMIIRSDYLKGKIK